MFLKLLCLKRRLLDNLFQTEITRVLIPSFTLKDIGISLTITGVHANAANDHVCLPSGERLDSIDMQLHT